MAGLGFMYSERGGRRVKGREREARGKEGEKGRKREKEKSLVVTRGLKGS